jgi:CheY-like chemotaxis protein
MTKSRSILIIDNDESIVEFLSFFFESKDFTVYTALDGVEGVNLALLHKPAVIISDMMMGQMHGFEVLQRIRSHPELASAVLIVASAKSYKPDIDRAKQLGATDYVVKPFKAEELYATVERHLMAAS